MREAGEGVEALGLAAQGLGQHLAGDVGVGHAVAAAALGVVDVVADPADLGQAGQRQQEVAGPGEVDLHVLQLREGLEHLRPDDGLDVGRVTGTVDHATAVDQALVAGEAVVVQQVVAVLYAVILRQQRFGHFFRQRLGGDHLGAAGHGLAGQFGNQVAHVGVAGHDHELGLHAALRGMHHRVGTALDACGRALLVDHATQGLGRGGFAQGQVQRVDVAAAHVQHAADVIVGRGDFTNALGVQHLQLGMTVALPQLLLRLQMLHLLRGEGCEHAAVLQVALDVVLLDAVADDAAALERHLAHQLGMPGVGGALDHVDIAAIAVHDLAAVAAGGTKTYLGGFEDGYLEAVLQQEEGSGKPGIACAYDADVGFGLADQFRARRNGVGRERVIGLGVGSVRHNGISVFYFLQMERCYLS
ncbi:hypothetical protein D9M68_616200 [compost metagenome]